MGSLIFADASAIIAIMMLEAISAFDRFGQGRGHPAQLNMGDCFAYAAARRHHAALLFTGSDFSPTDIARVSL